MYSIAAESQCLYGAISVGKAVPARVIAQLHARKLGVSAYLLHR